MCKIYNNEERIQVKYKKANNKVIRENVTGTMKT